jgi:nucleoid-associated protein EbfC
MNMQKMLKEMQKMQGKMMKAQEDLEGTEFKAEAGGGMVKITINGKGMLTDLKLDEDAVDPDDVEALEDLLIAAFNQALTDKEKATQDTMGGLTNGMNIPGMPF